MKKSLAVIALAASLGALGVAAAQAADTYPAPAPSSTVSQGTVKPGGTVTFSGRGFTPGEQIVITVSSGAGAGIGGGAGGVARSVPMVIPALATQTITTVADAAGAFSIDVVLTDPGAYTLTAVGAVSGVTQTSTVTVAVAPAVVAPASVPELASTGAGSGLLIWSLVGAGVIVAGAGSVVVARRRPQAAS